MIIDNQVVVTLSYKLTNRTTGEKIEETSPEQPLVFLYGAQSMIPDFEANLKGKKQGEAFEFGIDSANAYGETSEEKVVDIPIHVFHNEEGKIDEQIIKVGAMLPMSDNQGNHLTGTIRALTAEEVKMDFNHPLAGVDLHFAGEIIEVREATTEEIEHGHVHGPGGHHH